LIEDFYSCVPHSVRYTRIEYDRQWKSENQSVKFTVLNKLHDQTQQKAQREHRGRKSTLLTNEEQIAYSQTVRGQAKQENHWLGQDARPDLKPNIFQSSPPTQSISTYNPFLKTLSDVETNLNICCYYIWVFTNGFHEKHLMKEKSKRYLM